MWPVVIDYKRIGEIGLKNKKNIFIVIGSLLVILIILVGPFLMQHDEKTDNCSIDNQYYLQDLKNGSTVVQTFVMPGNRLNEIEIILTDLGAGDSGLAVFDLCDQTGKILDSSNVAFKDCENGQFQEIQFKKRPFLKKGATYSIVISIESVEEHISKIILLPSGNGTNLNQELKVDNTIVENYALAINYAYQDGPVSWPTYFVLAQIIAVISIVSVYIIKGEFEKKQSNMLFLSLLASLQFIWLISVMVTKGQTLSNLIHPNETDQFMDFFNSIRYGRTPYENGVIYPPLANLIYAFLGRIIPSNRLLTPGEVRNTQMGGIVFFLYTLVIMYALVQLMHAMKYMFPTKVQNVMFDMCILISTPFAFCYERGNIILLCLVCCMGFCYFRSKGRTKASILSLALAVGLKIYPAVFGLIELKTGNKKKIARMVIVSIIVFVLPFVFFPKGSIELLLNNIQRTSEAFQMNGVGIRHDLENLMSIIHYACGIDIPQVVVTIVRCAFVLLGILVVLLDAKISEWKQLYISTAILILFPSFSYTYTLIFILIPLMSFMKNETFKRLDYLYLFLFLLVFMPYIVSSRDDILGIWDSYYPLTYATLFQTIAVVLMYILIIADSLHQIAVQHKRTSIYATEKVRN